MGGAVVALGSRLPKGARDRGIPWRKNRAGGIRTHGLHVPNVAL
jgi:hypothetical protein